MSEGRAQDPSTQGEPILADEDARLGWTNRLVPAAVVLVTVLAFLPSLGNGFVNWDDPINLEGNPHYRGLGWSNLRWMFTTFHAGPYQPLSWVTLGADYVVWGMDARGYHLTSLLFHAATVLAFYFLALRLFERVAGRVAGNRIQEMQIAAAVAALLFGVHPFRVESVAWATERRDVVSGLFFMLTLLAYLRACEPGRDSSERLRWLGASLLVYLASLLGKGMGITLPLVLVILDVYPLRRLGTGRGDWFGPEARGVWLEKLPYLALAVVIGAVGVIGQISMGAVATLGQYGLERRIGVALFATAFYLYRTVMPVDLSPLYPMPRHLSLTEWRYVLSAGVLAAITIVAVLARRRWLAGLAVWISYLGMLAPVTGLTQMGPQIAADRYTYLPCLGWALLGGWAVGWARRGRFVATIVRVMAGLVVVVLGVLTWRQTTIWHDSVSLWEHAGRIYPGSHLIQRNWGAALGAVGDRPGAAVHYREAVRLAPESGEAHNNLGLALAGLGEVYKAVEHLRTAIDLKPTDGSFYYNLANTYVKLGRLGQAVKNYHLALKHRPSLVQARINLANTLSRLGRDDEAEKQWLLAIDENPQAASAYANLATELIRQGRNAEAVKLLRSGIRACPADGRLRLLLEKAQPARANR